MEQDRKIGEQRARETFGKMEHPKMRSLIDDFVDKLGVSIPSEYRSPFLKCWELHNEQSGPFREIADRPKYNRPDLFYELINGEVQEKFHAVYYHQKNADSMQKLVEKYCVGINEVAKELEIEWPVTVGITLRKLHFEYEAFVFQCRACLDHFAGSVSYYFGFIARNLDRLKSKLEQLSLRNPKARKILDVMEKDEEFYLRVHELLQSKTKNRDFLKDWSDRDKMAHYGKILMRPLNVMINPASGTKILHLARQEKGKDTFNLPRLTELMESFMRDLFKFIAEVYDIIFEK